MWACNDCHLVRPDDAILRWHHARTLIYEGFAPVFNVQYGFGLFDEDFGPTHFVVARSVVTHYLLHTRSRIRVELRVPIHASLVP